MLRKIKVYGKLRQLLGKSTFEADLNNVGQAFSFLINNFPQINEHIQNSRYKVYSGDKLITEETLVMSGCDDVKIIPVATGSKFLAGAALLGVGSGAVLGGATAGFFATTIGGVVASGLTAMGTSMLIDGVTSMLSPQPQGFTPSGMDATDPSSLASNYSFSGITNISKSGVPINLIYGETIVGSCTVSNGIDTVQVRGDA